MDSRFRVRLSVGVLLMGLSSFAFSMDLLSPDGQAFKLRPVVQSPGWTLVMLWAHDCLPCEQQKPMIEEFHQRTHQKGVTVVGVSTDPVALRHKAIETYLLTETTFQNYFFEGHHFPVAFNELTGKRFLGTPTYLLFDANGQLQGMHTGSVSEAMLARQFEPLLQEPQFVPVPDEG